MRFHASLALALLFPVALAAQAAPTGATLPPPPPPTDTTLLARGAEARLVGPGVISREFSEFGAAFADQGRTMFYVMTDGLFSRMTILRSTTRGDGWSAPTVAPFSGTWNDGDVAARPDGKRIFFISNRPLTAGGAAKADLDIWYVDATADGRWSDPVHAGPQVNSSGPDLYPQATAGNVLYFARPDGIYRSEPTADGYGAPVKVDAYAGALAISPDERTMIVGVRGKAAGDTDLGVRRRQADGTWGPVMLLPVGVNSPGTEQAPAFSPDGRRLYFGSQRRLAPVAWPRTAPVRSFDGVLKEFTEPLYNGLRNLFVVDLATPDGR